MNFREFLRLDEIFDIASMDTSGVELKVEPWGFSHKFQHDGENYEIKMPMREVPCEIGRVETYTVDFQGPSGHSLTGEAGMSANIIYSKLLLVVKKLLETTDVNALKFSAYDPRMAPMYRLFYTKFLRPNPPRGAGFIMMGNGFYVRKDIVKERLEQGRRDTYAEYPQDVMSQAIQANRDNLEEVEKVNQNKKLKRQLVRIFKKDGIFIYVVKVRKGPEVLMVSKRFNSYEDGEIYFRDIYTFKRHMDLSTGPWEYYRYDGALPSIFVELVRPATSEEIEQIKQSKPDIIP